MPGRSDTDRGPAAGKAGDVVLDIVRQLHAELHPPLKGRLPIALDSRLERELGFDSLARVELIARIEHAFGVSLLEQTLTTAETPRDLWRAVRSAHPAPHTLESRAPPAAPSERLGPPAQAQTLVEILEWYVQAAPDQAHIHWLTDGNPEEVIRFAELYQGAQAVAAGLEQQGLEPGQTVAIMLPTGREYFFSFFGVLLAHAIPVPIYPPLRLAQIEDHLRRHARILANAQAILLITVAEARPVSQLLRSQVERLRRVVTVPELVALGQGAAARAMPGYPPRPEDIAMLQYTSGSTGNPKGVILTHANLLANIRAMGGAIQAGSNDVFVSWMPLYHDMGLIGAWLGSLYYGVPLVVMSPLLFLTRPERWLWAIHQHRATLSGAPNFGYELCLRRVQDRDIEGLDLSSWRLAFNGAEPVSPDTLARFQERFAPYGLRPETQFPVYGLAEASVGLAFPPLGRAPLIDRVNREVFMRTRQAWPSAPNDPHALRFVACGQPLPGHQIRIVDAAGFEAGEREEGRLEFQGPSATSGYFRNAEETRRLFHDGWLDSGDLAYLAGGDVYITGRVKDLIIRAGRNIYPQELEEAVGNIAGIRKGCIAVFGVAAPGEGTERLVVLAETRVTDAPTRERLRTEINAVAMDLIGGPPDEVVLAPPYSVLKTSSGKIRRAASRELYEHGRIGTRSHSPWRQFAHLIGLALAPLWRRARRTAGALLYAMYAWILFGLMAPVVWSLVALLPRPSWSWAVSHTAARWLLRLSGTPLRVQGLAHLPRGPCVLVANHASYLDSIILAAVLPRIFSFVAKRELTGQFIARVFLKHIEAEFVERFELQRGVEDARQMARIAATGRSLVFFPEGTFARMPGIMPFHLGAFVAAAAAGVPVVPVAIRGTRSILRSGQWFPRRGAIGVTVGAALVPEGSDWAAAIRLRDAARALIRQHAGEPDLVYRPPT
jgi:1-acyl-sn-glycerol-3-phosphate acyltransferase